MLYILKHNLVLKIKSVSNDESKSVYTGTKSSVSVSEENVQANLDCVSKWFEIWLEPLKVLGISPKRGCTAKGFEEVQAASESRREPS